MRKPNRAGVWFIAVLLAVAGCSVNRAAYIPYGSRLYPPKGDLEPVLIAHDVSEPYEELGTIVAHGLWHDGYERVNELLKKEARETGADAVIKINYWSESVFGLSLIFFSVGYSVAAAQGVAIKFKKNATPLVPFSH